MLIRFASIFIVIAIIAAVIVTGIFEEPELPTPESTSIDGAVIETGLQLDDNNKILSLGDTFTINQDFYIHFDNNGAFEQEQVTFQLIDTKNDEILAQENYDVDIEDTEVYSIVYFSSPGLYRIVDLLGGNVRATSLVIIKQ